MEDSDYWIRFFNHHSRLMEIRCWKDFLRVDVSGCMWMWWEYAISGVESVGFSGAPNNGTPFPYYSHTTPIRIPKMGITEAGRRTWCWLRPVLAYKLLLRPSRRFFLLCKQRWVCLLSLIMDVVENHFHESWFHLLLLGTFFISNPTKSFDFLGSFSIFFPTKS